MGKDGGRFQKLNNIGFQPQWTDLLLYLKQEKSKTFKKQHILDSEQESNSQRENH